MSGDGSKQNAGAKLENYSTWCDGFPTIGKFETLLIQEFLFHTPAIDVSVLSQGFIKRFGTIQSDAYEALFDELTDGIPLVKKANTAKDLEVALVNKDLLDGDFWKHGEMLVMCTSGSDLHVKEAVEESVPASSGLSASRKDVVRSKLTAIDSLFRHIRNSLAHGQFSKRESSVGSVIVFQDVNKNGNVSSRMVLTEQRLQSWITEIHRLEKTGL